MHQERSPCTRRDHSHLRSVPPCHHCQWQFPCGCYCWEPTVDWYSSLMLTLCEDHRPRASSVVETEREPEVDASPFEPNLEPQSMSPPPPPQGESAHDTSNS